jgi:hypothetical protein
MKNIKVLLLDADPIRHENTLFLDGLARRRQAILAEASTAGTTRQRQTRQWFIVVAMAALAALFFHPSLRSLFVTEVQAAVAFEVRLAEDRPGPGLREVKVSGSDRSVYLHNDVVVTNGDISRAQVVEGSSPSQFSVSVEFTAAGTQKMRSATAAHIGKPVAILLDGQVVMAPVLRSPIGSSALITGDHTKAEAERIVNGIR